MGESLFLNKLGLYKEKERELKKKKFAHSSARSFDLLYQLSYMSVIATSGAPRNQIFNKAAQIPCASAEYFNKVELISQKLGYDYAKACRTVGEQTHEEDMKGLLLRFASSLISGEPESDFLVREAEAQAEVYNNLYGRKLETLKLWTDAYVSLILSAVLIIIVGVVSTMVWKIEMVFIVGLVMTSICTSVMGIWLIYLMTPRETTLLKQAGTREQKLARKVFRLTIPIALTIAAILMVTRINEGWVLLAVGVLISPAGIIMILDDKRVARRDSEIGTFLRSLGGVASATGTTVREALGRLDLDAMYNLRFEVKRLHTRFLAGIRAELCWDKFVEETGSEMANRSVGMFHDAIDLGGEPEKAGYQASLFASNIAMLRARRKTVSFPFQWLCIAMHGAVVVLLVFITEIITIFGKLVTKASQAMPKISGAPSISSFTSFNFTGLDMLTNMVLPLVIVFTVANAMAPSIADGGSRYKFLFNFSITAFISGACLTLLPAMANSLFGIIKM